MGASERRMANCCTGPPAAPSSPGAVNINSTSVLLASFIWALRPATASGAAGSAFTDQSAHAVFPASSDTQLQCTCTRRQCHICKRRLGWRRPVKYDWGTDLATIKAQGRCPFCYHHGLGYRHLNQCLLPRRGGVRVGQDRCTIKGLNDREHRA